jgi:hypothetical protein
VLDAAISFASGAVAVMPVIIASELHGEGLAFAGVLGAGAGVGAMLGGLTVGILRGGADRRITGAVVVVMAMAIAALGMTASPVTALGTMVVAVAGIVVLDVVNVTTLQLTVDDGRLGRALGLLHTSAGLWLVAGSAVPPVLAAVIGVDVALLATGAVVVVLGGLSLIHLPGRWPGVATGTRSAEI